MSRVACMTVLGICAISICSDRHRTVLDYSFEPVVTEDKLILHVALEFQSAPVDTADLVTPTAWGEATDLQKGITNLQNVHEAGKVRVTYDLVKDWVVPPPRADHHAILEPSYFEFNTQNALVHPRLEKLAQVEVHLDWQKLPINWSLATSFGTTDRLQTFRGSWGKMNDALFAGGDFRLHQRTIAGRTLSVAIRSQWRFTDDEAADRIEKVVALERAFWHDYDFPYYLVTVSTFGREDGSSGGGGFTNAFALYLQRTSSFGQDVQSQLAHETFHTWNPYRMGAVPDSDAGMSWFTEGFTRYYQDVVLLRAGMLSFVEYVQKINESLRNYLLSPARNVSNAELIDRRRRMGVDDDLTYSRGAATALWLDWTIRNNTRGKSSLDNLMLDLVRDVHGSKPALTVERVFRSASKYVDAEDLKQLREYVDQGKTIPVPDGALGRCADIQMDDIPRFDLGMDRETLLSQHIVSGVKAGSAAFAAGARDGQQVTRTNIYWNDVSKPVQLTVKSDGESRAIEYYPRGESIRRIPQYHLSGEAVANPGQCVAVDAQSASFR
jgi:predicted metalloprotease with PDZ domain